MLPDCKERGLGCNSSILPTSPVQALSSNESVHDLLEPLIDDMLALLPDEPSQMSPCRTGGLRSHEVPFAALPTVCLFYGSLDVTGGMNSRYRGLDVPQDLEDSGL